ncbi:LytTR family transcriptional regulator DNA-binding domain-containing protein [uncultured Psychroserpens sp.]|uniref:LytTR family transcriptional regulator DNA-binding domain-containing protein n=1 Tax=uncultured Psychroserpens sp. TaxID=255436 RepID=UPI002609CDB4|nr:LytTR family transcriptional regulator DNA-binding domain-containing protein [uncultured Psychroserpens sp.]
MNTKYPFDPSIKHHLIIALGLAIWIFVFLYFTEPLDVNEFGDTEKLIYLPIYGLIGALLYVVILPMQIWLYKKNGTTWKLSNELLLITVFICIAIITLRLFYLHFIVEWHPNAYEFWYHLKAIMLPAILTILPIVIIGRFAFGKYKNKKLEEQKIEIKGEGNYEGLRLLLKDLICIQSSDNYIEIFYSNGNQLKKTLIRNKLSVIEDSFPELLRTHRSFIINPFHFQSWKIERSKHFLALSYQIEVPISKTYLENIKAQLDFTTV